MRLILIVMVVCLLSGCNYMQTYSYTKAVGFAGFDYVKRYNDVVLVKSNNMIYPRRGWNPFYGCSKELLENGNTNRWNFVEKNPDIQIYSNVMVANLNSYDAKLSDECKIMFRKESLNFQKKYKDELDNRILLLKRMAEYEEARSKLKQSLYKTYLEDK